MRVEFLVSMVRGSQQTEHSSGVSRPASLSYAGERHLANIRQITFGEGKTWAGQVGVSTRLLFLLASEGRIIRGRPKGTWLSSLYRWAPMDRWVEGGLEPWPAERARVELVRRWLRAFGPGTVRDIQWWTGWTVARAKAALQALDAVVLAGDTLAVVQLLLERLQQRVDVDAHRGKLEPRDLVVHFDWHPVDLPLESLRVADEEFGGQGLPALRIGGPWHAVRDKGQSSRDG